MSHPDGATLLRIAATVVAADRCLAPRRRRVPLPVAALTYREFATEAEALAWCDATRPDLVHGVRYALIAGRVDVGVAIALGAVTYYKLRGHHDDWLTTAELAARAAADLGDRSLTAWTQNSLGGALATHGQTTEAVAAYEKALALAQNADDQPGTAMALSNLAEAHLDRPHRALDYADRAVRIARQIGDTQLEANAIIDALAPIWRTHGRDHTATTLYRRATDLTADHDHRLHGLALYGLARVLADHERRTEALSALDAALETQQLIGDLPGQAATRQAIDRLRDSTGK